MSFDVKWAVFHPSCRTVAPNGLFMVDKKEEKKTIQSYGSAAIFIARRSLQIVNHDGKKGSTWVGLLGAD